VATKELVVIECAPKSNGAEGSVVTEKKSEFAEVPNFTERTLK
jgi:hypothetical protein